MGLKVVLALPKPTGPRAEEGGSPLQTWGPVIRKKGTGADQMNIIAAYTNEIRRLSFKFVRIIYDHAENIFGTPLGPCMGFFFFLAILDIHLTQLYPLTLPNPQHSSSKPSLLLALFPEITAES